jgi:hypothetical protein
VWHIEHHARECQLFEQRFENHPLLIQAQKAGGDVDPGTWSLDLWKVEQAEYLATKIGGEQLASGISNYAIHG